MRVDNRRQGRTRETTGSRGTMERREIGIDTRGKAAVGIGNTNQRPKVPKKAFKTEAVAIKSMREGEVTYAEISGKAKDQVSLKDLGIDKSRIRVAANGGRIIEIPGPGGKEKADSLAKRLREVIGEEATVSRPMARGEFRLSGFDDSVSGDEIAMRWQKMETAG